MAKIEKTEDEWRQCCAAIGQPDLADDPRFASAADRKANEEELEQSQSPLLRSYRWQEVRYHGCALPVSWTNVQSLH